MKEARSADKFWSLFGKISLVVVTIAGLVTIIALFLQARPRLDARATMSLFQI